ncbi:unnamed protein product [Rotaria socialis]|uniref:Uncharacterized protein n=1 Tax=Rotaria socialis TaxID=392032 RepID=A0A817ZFS3_9BILA|nr:unnamed protein product [Rotaria socialis]CAF3391167.1 unnamed protein product [Rotaria socialis]CAF3661700.1 unnamed protein product [Rotaria socialis]
MKEYTYEAERSWEKHRRPGVIDHQARQRHQRQPIGDDAAMDADASSMSETTSESGVSDLETSMTDFRCSCCPYGYHLDTDFMKFLDDMYGPDVLRTLKKIEQKRHDVRLRLINEQPNQTIPIQTCTQQMNTTNSSSSFDNQILRETLLELDRIVEKDIKELEAECHRHANQRTQSNRSGHVNHQRSRSVDSRRHLRPPPRPPTSSSTGLPTGIHTSSSTHTAEEQRLYERRTQLETTITTRTRSAPRLNVISTDTMSSLRKINTAGGGPITMLYKIPPPPFSRSSSTSSLSTETTLRVSSPEPDEHEPLKPLYITEITVPPKPIVHVHEARKTTVVTITDKTEIERRNREIERLEQERKTLLTEKEILLKEIDRYKHKPVVKVPEQKSTSVSVITDHEHIEKIHTQNLPPPKPATREVAMQHIVEDEKPPPLPPKQRQQRDVAISHRTEYDDDEKQTEIVRRKLEEIKNFYTERIHYLEDRIHEQEKDIERLSEPKSQRHVNTQCQPTMQDRALVTDTFRSVRDVALTCHLQPTLPGPVAHRDVNVQCNRNDLIQQCDVSMEVIPDVPMKRDVSIGVSIGTASDKHYRDVGTHVNFDFKPEIRQRDVAIMFVPEPIQKHDQSSNTNIVQTREFGVFANTIEPPKPPPRPSMRPAATDTRNLIIQKDTACGADETKRGCDMSTDTSCLRILNDRACGLDFPRELLSRHISTDTRTLISTRDNFSATAPIVQTVQIHAQTQSTPTLQHDASSNTFPPAEQRHISVQAVQQPPAVKHSTTSIDVNVFHQLGHLRHSVSNTEPKRSTDRSTVTERQQLCDLAINTEPKIMYSKDVGDFDVRIGDEEHEKEYVEHQEFTWNTLHGRRPSLHGQRITLDCGFQTDLRDTKREVGYIERPLLKQREDTIEEQRQEIITFRVPRQSQETTTEETYEAVVTKEKPRTTDKTEEIRSQIKHDDSSTTTMKSEFTEWSRTFGSNTKKSTVDIKKQEDIRSRSPEELVEESYEIVSTIEKPWRTDSLITSTTQQYVDLTSGKLPSSEDDSSYCEEWTVTEAKRKKDGQTVKTIIDRGGHHRYNIDTEHLNISSKDTSTETSSQLRHHSGESSHANLGTQIREHEEVTQVSPSIVRKTTTYEAHRTLGTGQPVISATSTGFRTFPTVSGVTSSSSSHAKQETTDEQDVEEKYEVTLSTYDESGLRILSAEPMSTISIMNEEFKLDEEMYIACAIVNESLYDKNADKKKVNNCLQLIQQEWFRISSQKQVNDRLVSGYLNSIKEHFSNFLLERIVNLQDANGNTALHYCVTNGHWHVVTMLLDTKVCDVCLQNNAGYTAVMMAAVIDIANDEQRQVVRRLFRESGNVNVKTTASNQTALMLAVQHEKPDLVELLLENGAAVNLQDTDGSTALMCAVEHGSLTIVKLLLTRPECDVNITDNDGQTAVTIATNKDRKDILVALYAKMKERKGHHSALGSKSRTPSSSIPSRLPTADRSTTSSSNWKTSTETTSSSSRRSSGDSGSNAGPTVSTFRRF